MTLLCVYFTNLNQNITILSQSQAIYVKTFKL